MRDYAKVSPSFWTGETGRKFRGDLEAQVVALYLATGPHATMSGLYYLAIPILAHETGIPSEGASKALRRVCAADFAVYDAQNEAVWVKEMARFQVGDHLKANDKRSIGIAKEVERFKKTGLFYYFYERYRAPFRLPDPGPIEAPSKPLRSQEQEQEQEQEQYKTTDPVPGKVKPLTLVSIDPSPSFDLEAIYATFPRKEGKKEGLSRLRKQIKTPADYDRLALAVANYARKVKLDGTEPKYVKHFSSWTSVWEDYVELGLVKSPRDQTRDGYQVLE